MCTFGRVSMDMHIPNLDIYRAVFRATFSNDRFSLELSHLPTTLP